MFRKFIKFLNGCKSNDHLKNNFNKNPTFFKLLFIIKNKE